MNTTSEIPFWTQMRLNFLWYVKYIDPILLLVTICGAASLLVLIIVKKREIRFPTTTVIAICWLLSAEIAFLCCQFLIDLAFLGVMRFIQNESKFACYGFMFAMGTFLIMQSYVQAIISIERFVAVTKPLKVKMYITKLRMVALLCLVTVISAGVSVGCVKFGSIYKEHPKNSEMMVCGIQKVGLKVATFILLTWVLPPTSIATICTIGIIRTLISDSQIKTSVRDSLNSSRLSSAEKRLSMMLIAMNVILVLTSIPLSVAYFSITVNYSEKMRFFWNLSIFCTRFGTFTDWIIILVIGSQLRRALRKLFRIRRSQAPESIPLETEDLLLSS